MKKKDSTQNSLVAIDADNTLWDTNAVYAEGHLGLLQSLETEIELKADTADRLEFVREIDQELIRLQDYNYGYPVEYLTAVVAYCLKGLPIYQATTRAIRQEDDGLPNEIIEKLSTRFLNLIVDGVPPLRSGVRSGLQQLNEIECELIILTEGNETRCYSLLEKHNLTQYFHEIVVGTKDSELYEKTKESYSNQRFFMIGDQMDRDILPAKEVGFITILFPGGFQPSLPSDMDDAGPDYEISSFSEVPAIINTFQ